MRTCLVFYGVLIAIVQLVYILISLLNIFDFDSNDDLAYLVLGV